MYVLMVMTGALVSLLVSHAVCTDGNDRCSGVTAGVAGVT